MKVLLSVFLGIALISSAEAYPIFFKCDSQGVLSDILTAPEIQQAIRGSSTTQAMEERITEICAGKAECFSILKQALLLTQIGVEVANSAYQIEIVKLQSKAAALNQKIDPSVDRLTRNLYEMANEVYACRKSQESLPWKSFNYGKTELDSDGDYVDGQGLSTFIQHRVDNNYRYSSGYKDDASPIHRAKYNTLWTIVEMAVISDIDPYTALAVSFMENSEPLPVLLDPAAMLTMLGCESKKIFSVDDGNQKERERIASDLQSRGVNFIYSFGGFYEMKGGVKQSDVSRRISRLMNENRDRFSINADEPSYFCQQDSGGFFTDANGKVTESVGSSDSKFAGACCIQVPYRSNSVLDLLANEYMRKHLADKGTPEKILQSFNGGKATLMGINEKDGVGAFRLGINMVKDPQYGYQSIDFILNNFMSNPSIRNMIEQIQRIHGKQSKGVLCSGRAPGPYAVDSNHYLEKQQNSERFAVLMGKSWSAMTEKEARLMRHEWALMLKDTQGVNNPKISPSENADYQSKLKAFTGKGNDAEKWAYYKSNLYPYRRTLGQTSKKSGLPMTDDQMRETRAKLTQ